MGAFMAPLSLIRLTFALLCCYHAVGASHYLSREAIDASDRHDEVSELYNLGSRHLLQTSTSCTVNFQAQNYSIITDVCKGPQYPPAACCGALVTFACPFHAQLNDLSSDCARQMFTYINYYGQYPAGLFANVCLGNNLGLPCPPTAAPSPGASQGFHSKHSSTFMLWFLLLGSIAITLNLFWEGSFI